jgi:hypothetical protein
LVAGAAIVANTSKINGHDRVVEASAWAWPTNWASAMLAVFRKRRRFMTISGLNTAEACTGKVNVFSQSEFA